MQNFDRSKIVSYIYYIPYDVYLDLTDKKASHLMMVELIKLINNKKAQGMAVWKLNIDGLPEENLTASLLYKE